MNYRHGFHAGNFSDVFKQVTLLHLIRWIQKKESPFFYLETHAGRGWYDLSSEMAQKTQEWKSGVGKIWAEAVEPSLIPYLNVLNQFQKQHPEFGSLAYPGSPAFAQLLLRAQDGMIVCEKQREEWEFLKSYLKNDSRIQVQQQDGFLGLKAYLPPKNIKRGLIFLDPPYESDSDYQALLDGVELGLKRFRQGIFVIWYPIKQADWVQSWIRTCQARFAFPLLQLEWGIYPCDVSDVLHSSGLLIVNPPWQFAESMHAILLELSKQLGAHPKHLLRVCALQ